MKRTEKIIVNKTSDYLKSRIRLDISDGSEFGFEIFRNNDPFKEVNKEINRAKPFRGKIEENIITLIGKGFFYWPLTKIILEEKNSGKTEIKLIYKLYYLFLIPYIALILAFVLNIFESGSSLLHKENILVFVFLAILIFSPRWLQNNLKKYLSDYNS